MAEEERYRFTAKIGDVEPFAFIISPAEEPIYRRALFHVNDLWKKMRDGLPNKSSQLAMAKVALAFAELYYRKSEQLASQTKVLDDFEKELDALLLQTKG